MSLSLHQFGSRKLDRWSSYPNHQRTADLACTVVAFVVQAPADELSPIDDLVWSTSQRTERGHQRVCVVQNIPISKPERFIRRGTDSAVNRARPKAYNDCEVPDIDFGVPTSLKDYLGCTQIRGLYLLNVDVLYLLSLPKVGQSDIELRVIFWGVHWCGRYCEAWVLSGIVSSNLRILEKGWEDSLLIEFCQYVGVLDI